jgi:hypothetical protein
VFVSVTCNWFDVPVVANVTDALLLTVVDVNVMDVALAARGRAMNANTQRNGTKRLDISTGASVGTFNSPLH